MARVRHFVRWRSVGVAATFLLAALAGVVGNRLTGRVTPALVVFGALVIAGMLVTYILDRHVGAGSPTDGGAGHGGVSQDDPIRLHNPRGVQVGNYNWQQNYFGPGPEPGHRNDDAPTA